MTWFRIFGGDESEEWRFSFRSRCIHPACERPGEPYERSLKKRRCARRVGKEPVKQMDEACPNFWDPAFSKTLPRCPEGMREPSFVTRSPRAAPLFPCNTNARRRLDRCAVVVPFRLLSNHRWTRAVAGCPESEKQESPWFPKGFRALWVSGIMMGGGGQRIRTPGAESTIDFKSTAIDHSASPPTTVIIQNSRRSRHCGSPKHRGENADMRSFAPVSGVPN